MIGPDGLGLRRLTHGRFDEAMPAWSRDGRWIYYRQDRADGFVIATVKVGKAPYGAALAADGALLYVTNQHDDTVSVIDAELAEAAAHARPASAIRKAWPRTASASTSSTGWTTRSACSTPAAGSALGSIATGTNSRGFGAFIGAPMTP